MYYQYRISIVEIRWSYNHIIYTMGFPVLVSWDYYVETDCWMPTGLKMQWTGLIVMERWAKYDMISWNIYLMPMLKLYISYWMCDLYSGIFFYWNWHGCNVDQYVVYITYAIFIEQKYMQFLAVCCCEGNQWTVFHWLLICNVYLQILQ